MLRDVSGQCSQCVLMRPVTICVCRRISMLANLEEREVGSERTIYCIADSHGGDGALTSAIANRLSSFGLAYALQCAVLHNSKKPSGHNRSGKGCRRFSRFAKTCQC